MIIIRTWGGIGNQLFQYVFGQYLRYRYNQEVFYDCNSFGTVDTLRQKELDAIDANIKYDGRCSFSKHRNVKNRILRYFFQMLPGHHYIAEGNSIPDFFSEKDIYYFQGYWQEIKFYEWLKQNVSSFSIQSKEVPTVIQSYVKSLKSTPSSVSVHIRRGDYFSPQNVKTFGVCDASFFESAIREIKRKVSNPKFYIFSDDPDWVIGNISLPENSELIQNYDIEQFAYIELMSFCKHHIISNSSFSWWGAVLNEVQDSITIAPNKWTLISDKTIALEKWTKIEI